MNTIRVLAMTLLTACLLVVAGPCAAGSLRDAAAAAKSGSWLVYRTARIPDSGAPCCIDLENPSASPRRACRLDSRNWNFDRDATGGAPVLDVYLAIREGKIHRAQAFGPDCPVDTTGVNVVRIETPTIDDVVAELKQAAIEREPKSGDMLAALSLHDGRAVDEALDDLADQESSDQLRRDAAFWQVQVRGARGFAAVERLLTASEGDQALRKHWVFCLSQGDSALAAASLHRIARHDRDAEVRGEALFWMAQADIAGARAAIVDAIARETSMAVRKRGVFALSQLPGLEAVEALDAIAADRNAPRELRREALFWLAQSDDDAAHDRLQRMLGAD